MRCTGILGVDGTVSQSVHRHGDGACTGQRQGDPQHTRPGRPTARSQHHAHVRERKGKERVLELDQLQKITDATEHNIFIIPRRIRLIGERFRGDCSQYGQTLPSGHFGMDRCLCLTWMMVLVLRRKRCGGDDNTGSLRQQKLDKAHDLFNGPLWRAYRLHGVRE